MQILWWFLCENDKATVACRADAVGFMDGGKAVVSIETTLDPNDVAEVQHLQCNKIEFNGYGMI